MSAHSKKVIVIIAPSPPPLGGMALQAQQLCKCLRSEGLEAKIIPTNPPIWRIFSTVRGLRTVVETWVFLGLLMRELPRVQILHILAASYWYFFLRVVPAVILGRLFGLRVILNYRGGAAERFFSLHWWAVKPLMKRVHAITVPSEFLRRVFAARGFCGEVIPNFVDLRRFASSPLTVQRSSSPWAPRLLVTRNLEPVYNAKMALMAFEEIKHKYPAARIDVVGAGREEGELRAWVGDRQLKDVFFHGAVPNEQMPGYLQNADILLNPSNVDNMPITLLEAFAASIPVVSTRAGGIPDLVGDEKAALLVEPGDHLAMARKIELLLQNPDIAKELTTYAKKLCQEFSWESVGPKWSAIYFSTTEMHAGGLGEEV